MEDRGTVHLTQNGKLMRMYNHWRSLKGMSRSQRKHVDLCHFMRVILILNPWRWFWQSEQFVPPPFFWVFFAGVLSALGYAIDNNQGSTVTVLEWGGVLIVAALGLCGLLLVAIHLIEKQPRSWKQRWTAALNAAWNVCYYGLFPLWWPLLKSGTFLYKRVLTPFGNWFMTKSLFEFTIRGDTINVIPVGFAFCVAILGVLYGIGNLEYQMWSQSWGWSLFGHGMVVIFFLLLFSIIAKKDQIHTWMMTDHGSKSPPKPKKEHETRKVVWFWLVSMKHHVCPLIEVKDEEIAA